MTQDTRRLFDAIHGRLQEELDPDEFETIYLALSSALRAPKIMAHLERNPEQSVRALHRHIQGADFDWIKVFPKTIALTNLTKITSFSRGALNPIQLAYSGIVLVAIFGAIAWPIATITLWLGVCAGVLRQWKLDDQNPDRVGFGHLAQLVVQDSLFHLEERHLSRVDVERRAVESSKHMLADTYEDAEQPVSQLTPLPPPVRLVRLARIVGIIWLLVATITALLNTLAPLAWTLLGLVLGQLLAVALRYRLTALPLLNHVHLIEATVILVLNRPLQRIFQDNVTKHAIQDFDQVLSAEFGALDEGEWVSFRGIISHLSAPVETKTLRRIKMVIEGRRIGTIAITGPRGSGKTTLLTAVRTGGLGLSPPPLVVSLDAPSKFEPGDFLAALLRNCCQAHIEHESKVDDTYFVPASRRQRLKFGVLWIAHRLVSTLGITIAAVAIGLGLYAWSAKNPSLAGAEAYFRASGVQLAHAWSDFIDEARARSDRALQLSPELVARILFVGGTLTAIGALVHLIRGPRKLPRGGTIRTIDVTVRDALRYLAYEVEYENESGAKGNVGTMGEISTRSTVKNSQRRTGFPELVTYAHRVIGQIATSRRATGCGLIVTIDELDRVGTGPEIEDFLAEIKGVFSAPSTIFILAVTDEVGSRFAARSVLGTSRIDNVMDHVIPMNGWSLAEARQLLRGPGASVPARYINLAYAYAGQHPRELIRVVNSLAEDAKVQRLGTLPTPSLLGFRFTKLRLLDSCDQYLAMVGGSGALSDRATSDVTQERQWIVALRERLTQIENAGSFVLEVLDGDGSVEQLRGRPYLSMGSLGLLAQAVIDAITLSFFLEAEARSMPGEIDTEILEELAGSRRHLASRPELAESVARAALKGRIEI